MHDIVCLVFYQSSVLVIEVIIGDMSKKKKKCVCVCMCVCVCCVSFLSMSRLRMQQMRCMRQVLNLLIILKLTEGGQASW